jgi:hypothetical protein
VVAPQPLPPAPGVNVRIAEVLFNDTLGQSIGVVDQDVRRVGNVYYVTITSAAASPDTDEVICQVHLVVSEFQLRLAAAATRGSDQWRPVPRSFKFAVYGATEQRPYQFNILNPR